MLSILSVGFGGFIGAVLRHTTGLYIQSYSATSHLPLHTIIINIVGSLIIGILTGYIDATETFNAELKNFLLIGMLGSFTTFSAFSHETFTLMRNQNISAAFLNIFISVFVGLTAVIIGYKVVRMVF